MINLFHDTLTGVRSALVDYEEVPDSLGTSTLLMESEGHKIKANSIIKKCERMEW